MEKDREKRICKWLLWVYTESLKLDFNPRAHSLKRAPPSARRADPQLPRGKRCASSSALRL